MRHSKALQRVLLTGAAAVALAGAARAEGPTHRFDIPAEDAATALRDFARQSHHQLLFPYDAVSGRRTPEIRGVFADAAVLDRLCAIAGLAVTSNDGSTITLAPRAQPQAAPAAAAGPQTVEEVVVTATKRPEALRNVPISITAVTQSRIESQGVQSVQDAIRYVPGVYFSSNGSNAGSYSIRGVSTSSAVGNTQSPVALYIDDVNVLDPFFPKITTNLHLFDIERVEVLRGPQGTLFGSGALGGAIRIVSNPPDPRAYHAAMESTVSGVQGGGAGYALNGMVNAPLVPDKLALRVVGYYEQDAGWIHNDARHEDNANSAVSEGGRAELLWTPTSDLSITGSVLLQDDRPHDSEYSYYSNKTYAFDSVVPNQNLNNVRIYNLDAKYDFHWASLTSVTTYADRDESAKVDFTGRAAALFGIDNPSWVTDAGPSRTFSQEVRLASPSAQRFRWLIGGIYLNNYRIIDEDVIIPGAQAIFGGTSPDIAFERSHRRTIETAVFGEVSYDIVDALTLTAGVRAFQDRFNLHEDVGGGANGGASTLARSSSESAATPKFAITYKYSPGVTFYAQAAEGYRVGQSNISTKDPASGQVIPSAYGPDHLWNYELGGKASLLGGRLSVDADVYYIDWSQIQLNQRTLVTGLMYIGNAGRAHIDGAEVEATWRPLRSLELGGSLSLTDSRLDSVEPGITARVGDQLPGSAKVMAASYVQYTRPIGDGLKLFGRVDEQYVSREYSDLDNPTAATYGDFVSVDLRLGVDIRNTEIVGFIDNIADGDARTSAFFLNNQAVAIRERPRTYGLTVRARF